MKDCEAKVKLLFAVFLFCSSLVHAQYAPGVGEEGSTAIHKDSSIFIGWASSCIVERGWQQISDTSLGKATSGEPEMAVGKANGLSVVSLGDGGSATLTFALPIGNGEGFDFVVFENSFDGLFLELAFVEVSSDGENFVRFESNSLTDASSQKHDTLDPTLINNLAGKYKSQYGTPFDLEELKDHPDLDVGIITHVRIIDVVGSIDSTFASYDSQGRIINDPFPTPFATGGFDLDGVGIIYSPLYDNIQEDVTRSEFKVFPNPVQRGQEIRFEGNAEIYSITGVRMSSAFQKYNTATLERGVYIVKSDNQVNKLIVR